MIATQQKLGSRSMVILNKEFREIFRDRRTVFSVIISPLLITPLLFAFIGSLVGGQVEKARTQVYNVQIVNAAAAPQTARMLRSMSGLKIHPESGGEDVEHLIKDRKLDLALVLPADADQRLADGRSTQIQVLEDAGNQTSQTAAARVSASLLAIGQQVIAQRLSAAHLSPEYARPFVVVDQPIRSGGNGGTVFLAMMLPYILTLSALTGAIYAALDQVAGEKERGTLETLLVSPASRRDIVLGKFGAVVGVCLLSSILSIAGLILAFSLHMKGLNMLAEGGLHLSGSAIGVCLLVMLPLSVLFAGLLLAVSTFSRNQKEAQTYLAPLMMVTFVPIISSMFLGADASIPMALVPILGASIIIKQALAGSYNVLFIILAFAASAVYAALALAFATRLFQRESVLIKA